MTNATTGRFVGKSVIVTGSSNGIGQAAAIKFAKEGAFVTIHGRSMERLKATKSLMLKEGFGEEGIHMVHGALDDPKTLEELIEDTAAKFGRIDVLVNNAGVGKHPDHDPNSAESFDHVFTINVKTPMLLTEKAAPFLEKTKGNVIVISGGLSIRTHPHFMVYTMSCAARDHFVRNATNLYTPRGIRVNCVNPGITRTGFGPANGISEEAIEAMYASSVAKIPAGRVAEPSEVANIINFLASDDASYVTGATWFVDGGITCAPVYGTPAAQAPPAGN